MLSYAKRILRSFARLGFAPVVDTDVSESIYVQTDRRFPVIERPLLADLSHTPGRIGSRRGGFLVPILVALYNPRGTGTGTPSKSLLSSAPEAHSCSLTRRL